MKNKEIFKFLKALGVKIDRSSFKNATIFIETKGLDEPNISVTTEHQSLTGGDRIRMSALIEEYELRSVRKEQFESIP